ncbi:hypothetical protein EV1_011933 [Malus domestica]
MASTAVNVKQEPSEKPYQIPNLLPIPLSSDSSSSSSSSASSVNSSDIEGLETNSLFDSVTSKLNGDDRDLADGGDDAPAAKKAKRDGERGFVLPLGFLRPLPPLELSKELPLALVLPDSTMCLPSGSGCNNQVGPVIRGCKQFWKAGDYEGDSGGIAISGFSSAGMDHVRVHPKFLHSNATSHKWALGAFAELLDNALDEVCNGANHVCVDVVRNKKDGNEMLMVEDDGGGMTPKKMRECMSLGYSAKSKLANTIGQYGNGFKTSTMRLGADVIVFSRCEGEDGRRPTQTIGVLSYTFLRGTGKEDIVVPMIDYEKRGQGWNKMMRGSPDDWHRNLATIVQWSPYLSEEDLLQQFNLFKEHGTRIIIYNLWEDDEGKLELDFDTDPHDIQIRGVNRDEKNIQMAKRYPNSRHFLTYRHSLRSYASILYLRLPYNFRIILRGKDVEHHNIVNDMMLTKEVTYRPLQLPEGMSPKVANMTANVTLGFVKDAKDHIAVQGFSVYHKNRLIKPFWRLWNPAGSQGRGIIGVLEADFVEPTHDKQGFERTAVLSRLENKLVKIQKDYWYVNCQTVGYAPVRRTTDFPEREPSVSVRRKSCRVNQNCHGSSSGRLKSSNKLEKGSLAINVSSENGSCHEASRSCIEPQQDPASDERVPQMLTRSQSKTVATNRVGQVSTDCDAECSTKSKKESHEATESLREIVSPAMAKLLNERSCERCKSLGTELEQAKEKIEELEKEQSAFLEIIVQEKAEREQEEERLRKSLTDASNTIGKLLEKVKELEGRKLQNPKVEHE